jgi:hypothetical protein
MGEFVGLILIGMKAENTGSTGSMIGGGSRGHE